MVAGGSSRRPSFKGGSHRSDRDSREGDDDDEVRTPSRRQSILQALPQLFGGWRGNDKSKMAAKAKSFKGMQSLSNDEVDSSTSSSLSSHLPNINAPRRASASHHDLVPGLLHVHSPKGGMKNSESDPNFKTMGGMRRGLSSNNLQQLPTTSQHHLGGGGGGGGVSSKISSEAVKGLKVIDSRLQDKSESIEEHLSMAEAMIARQNSSVMMPGGMVKQPSVAKLSASSRF